MLRKAILLLLLASSVSLSVSAQVNYKVIKVNGSIVYVRDGSAMTQGDVFPEDENLSFGTPTSRAAVINPEKGRFILKPDNPDNLAAAKTHFMPGMNNISTRGGAFNNVQDLQNHFTDTLVLLSKTVLSVNPVKFPMDEDNFFFLTFTYKGEKINRKLEYTDNQLYLDRSKILLVDWQPIEAPDKPDMSISYFTPEGITPISSFVLQMPDPEAMKYELSIILEGMTDKSYASKINGISGYLYEFYGKPDKKDVMQYLEDEFGLTQQ